MRNKDSLLIQSIAALFSSDSEALSICFRTAVLVNVCMECICSRPATRRVGLCITNWSIWRKYLEEDRFLVTEDEEIIEVQYITRKMASILRERVSKPIFRFVHK